MRFNFFCHFLQSCMKSITSKLLFFVTLAVLCRVLLSQCLKLIEVSKDHEVPRLIKPNTCMACVLQTEPHLWPPISQFYLIFYYISFTFTWSIWNIIMFIICFIYMYYMFKMNILFALFYICSLEFFLPGCYLWIVSIKICWSPDPHYLNLWL